MNESLNRNRRLLASLIIPAAILIGLLLATGQSLFGGGSSQPPPPPTVHIPAAAPTATVATGAVQGVVTVDVRRLGGNTYRFMYTVHDIGTTPIAGFQVNGAAANLYAIAGPRGWTPFGSGVCGGRYPGVLIYWSTGSGSASVIRPRQTVRFAFSVNTAGASSHVYSLSFGQATPQFGMVQAPRPSTLPAPGSCQR